MSNKLVGAKDFFDVDGINAFLASVEARTKSLDDSFSALSKHRTNISISDIKAGSSTLKNTTSEILADEKKLYAEKARLRKEDEIQQKRKFDREFNEAKKRNDQINKDIQVEKNYEKAISMTVKTEKDLIFQTNSLVAKRKTLDLTTKEGIALDKQLTKQIAIGTAELKSRDAMIGRHQREVGNYGKALNGLGGALKGLVGAFGLTGGLMIFASIMSSAFKEMMAFSKAVSNLSAITGIAGNQLNYLKGKAIEMGAGVEGGATAVIESYKLIASANSDLASNADALAEISKQAIILSQASGSTLQDSTQQLMQILNKMGVEASGSGKSLDILAASAKWGTAEIPQVTEALLAMGGTMKLVAKSTNSANDNVREANALIQVLAKNGKVGADAGIGLRNVLLKLAAVDVLPKSAVKQLKDAGVNMAMLKDTTIPLADRLKELSKISGNAAALTKVFGVENIEVGKIILDNTKLFDDYNIKLDENGVAVDQAKTNMNNLSGDLVKAQSTWKSLMLSFESGEGTTGKFLRGIVQQVTKLMEMFQRSESGMFKGLESVAIAGNESEIEKQNILFEKNIEASNKRRNSTKSEIEQKQLLLDLVKKQIKEDEITLFYDRQKAELSPENKLNMAYQNGALALRIKYLKEQAGLIGMNLTELTKKEIKDNTEAQNDNNNSGAKGNKTKKEKIDLLKIQIALQKALNDEDAKIESKSSEKLVSKMDNSKLSKDFEARQQIRLIYFEMELEREKQAGASSEAISEKLTKFKKQQAVEYLDFLLKNTSQLGEKERAAVGLLIEQLTTEINAKLDKSLRGRTTRWLQKVLGANKEDAEKIFDQTAELLDRVYSVVQQMNQKQIDAAQERADQHKTLSDQIKSDLDAEIEKQNELVKNGAAADQQKISSLKNRLAIEKSEQAKAEAEKKALEKRAQLMAITQANIGTAVAVVNALQTKPFYVGLIMAALAAAMGATEIATIRAQKYAVGTEYLDHPTAAKGTDTIPIMADRGERIMTAQQNAMIPKNIRNKDIPYLIQYAIMSKNNNGFGMILKNEKIDLRTTESYLKGILNETKSRKIQDSNGRVSRIYNGNNLTIYS